MTCHPVKAFSAIIIIALLTGSKIKRWSKGMNCIIGTWKVGGRPIMANAQVVMRVGIATNNQSIAIGIRIFPSRRIILSVCAVEHSGRKNEDEWNRMP